MIIHRTGLFSFPTACRAAEPSEEIMTCSCIPAPCASMATCGTPSGEPVRLIGWQITKRQPSRLGCFRVATTFPSTRAKSMGKMKNEECRMKNVATGAESELLRLVFDACMLRILFSNGRSWCSLIDSQVVHHDTAPDAAERFGIGHTFASGRGDRIAEVTFASESQACHGRAVLNEKGRIQRASH